MSAELNRAELFLICYVGFVRFGDPLKSSGKALENSREASCGIPFLGAFHSSASQPCFLCKFIDKLDQRSIHSSWVIHTDRVFLGKGNSLFTLDSLRHIPQVASFTQTILQSLIDSEFPSMTAFAKKCGVGQSLVWRDCRGREISDKRFIAYLQAFSPDSQRRLIRAKLRDLLPGDLELLASVSSTPRIQEKPSDLTLLPEKSQEILERLASEMARDSELHDWIVQFVQRVC